MKILMVNKFLYPNGGSETYIFELGKELTRQGHQVEYFGMEHENRIVGNHAESYTSNMDFHTGKLQKLMYPFKIIYSREARKKIRAVLRDFKPDIVHLNNFNYQLTPSIIYEIKAHKIPIVFTAHDLQLVCPNHLMMYGKTGEVCERCVTKGSMSCFRGKCIHGSSVKSLLGTLENWIYKRFKPYKRIDAIICPSHFVEEKLKQNPQLAGRTVVLRNFISELKKPVGVQKEDYALYFGRYSREKGVATLVEACRELPEVRFVFAGKGELSEAVDSVKNIENRGFLAGEELHRLVSAARFSICASECPENCPFSVMESLKLGTPVVGAAIGGIPELIQEGETGLLVESGSKDALKTAISRLWYDKEGNLQLIQGCNCVTYDNCGEYCKKILDIYKDCITKR